jgi:GT2 family glycosyltransferase
MGTESLVTTTAAIITTCDRPQMLARAVESVRRQSMPVDELIVVNDGMSEVVVDGATLLRTGPLAGPSAARNAGAAAARSDFVMFLDDDDLWQTDHVATIARLGIEQDVIVTAMQRHTRAGAVVLEVPPPTLVASDWLVGNLGVQGSNLAVRRQSFLKLLGFDEVLWCGEDMDFAIRAADAGLRYRRSEDPTVICHHHTGPRITSPGVRHRHAHRTFLAAHGSRMSAQQVQAFRERAQRLFGIDPGQAPRLVWVLGPPGAGKTTWAKRCARGRDRVMDCVDAMLWLDGADLGVRTAKRHLAAAIRATEMHRAPNDRCLFMTLAYFDAEDLGPPQSFEHVVAIVPGAARWHAQLRQRDGSVDEQHAREYARWVQRYGTGARAAPAESIEW